jgi:hypothetical protein
VFPHAFANGSNELEHGSYLSIFLLSVSNLLYLAASSGVRNYFFKNTDVPHNEML